MTALHQSRDYRRHDETASMLSEYLTTKNALQYKAHTVTIITPSILTQSANTYSLFHTAILENTQKMCPGMLWFWFILTASDFP